MHRAMEQGVREFLINDAAGNIIKRIDLGSRRQVIDGNAGADQGGNGDLRFLDPKGVIVGLYAKQGTLHLDRGHQKFFMRNPESVSVSVMGLPMGAMRSDGDHIGIDVPS